MKIRKLPKEIKHGKLLLTQIKREGDIAIYMEPDYKNNFEVVIIRTSKPHFMDDTGHDLVELYPCNTLWGKFGFTYSSLESAEKKFDELINQKENK